VESFILGGDNSGNAGYDVAITGGLVEKIINFLFSVFVILFVVIVILFLMSMIIDMFFG